MYAVVQVRGVVKTRREIKDTLEMLRLHHVNHCVVVPDTPEYLGMIRKVKGAPALGARWRFARTAVGRGPAPAPGAAAR